MPVFASLDRPWILCTRVHNYFWLYRSYHNEKITEIWGVGARTHTPNFGPLFRRNRENLVI